MDMVVSLKTIAIYKSYVGTTSGTEQARNENVAAFREAKVGVILYLSSRFGKADLLPELVNIQDFESGV